jgi:hypothetical protein
VLFVTRIALQVVLLFSLLSLVLAIGSPTSGAAAKATLAAAAVALVWVAARVRGLDDA